MTTYDYIHDYPIKKMKKRLKMKIDYQNIFYKHMYICTQLEIVCQCIFML